MPVNLHPGVPSVASVFDNATSESHNLTKISLLCFTINMHAIVSCTTEINAKVKILTFPFEQLQQPEVVETPQNLPSTEDSSQKTVEQYNAQTVSPVCKSSTLPRIGSSKPTNLQQEIELSEIPITTR